MMKEKTKHEWELQHVKEIAKMFIEKPDEFEWSWTLKDDRYFLTIHKKPSETF
jgi:hypothetical protein